jgi:hypothetical protein
MRSKFLVPLAALLSLSAAEAAPVLLAHGSISATSSDLSGLNGTLENGAPGNLLGGFGSGLGYAGGGTFVAVPDRGPNAISYNPLIDDTASYIDRFQTFKLQLTPSSGALPYTLTPVLTATTLLSSATPLIYGTGGVPALNAVNNTYYFTGRSDGFDPSKNSLNPANARFDPESIRVSNDGKSVFISDEYGPSIYQFDRSTGQRIRTFTLPDYFGVQNVNSRGNTEISGNTQGRLANKGMEGLALTPDGKTLVGIVQSPLIQDGGAAGVNLRIVTIDIATGAVTHAYVYKLSNQNNTVSDITAVNDHQFLVDERDGNSGLSAVTKQLFLIDVSGATDVKADSTLPANFTAVSKGAQPFLDLLHPPAASEPFVENAYLDLEPDSKLRIVLPLSKAEGASSGFEIAHYHVAAQRRGRVRLQFLSAEVTDDGKTTPESRPPVLPFALPSKAAYIRLLYLQRLSQTDHNMAVVAADRMDILERATRQIRADPNSCHSDSKIICSWVPAHVAIRPEK